MHPKWAFLSSFSDFPQIPGRLVLISFLPGSGSVSFLPGSGSVSKFVLDPDPWRIFSHPGSGSLSKSIRYGFATLPATRVFFHLSFTFFFLVLQPPGAQRTMVRRWTDPDHSPRRLSSTVSARAGTARWGGFLVWNGREGSLCGMHC